MGQATMLTMCLMAVIEELRLIQRCTIQSIQERKAVRLIVSEMSTSNDNNDNYLTWFHPWQNYDKNELDQGKKGDPPRPPTRGLKYLYSERRVPSYPAARPVGVILLLTSSYKQIMIIKVGRERSRLLDIIFIRRVPSTPNTDLPIHPTDQHSENKLSSLIKDRPSARYQQYIKSLISIINNQI